MHQSWDPRINIYSILNQKLFHVIRGGLHSTIRLTILGKKRLKDKKDFSNQAQGTYNIISGKRYNDVCIYSNLMLGNVEKKIEVTNICH